MTTLRGSYNFLWDVSKPLGQGATSMVYRGRNKSTGEEVAVKVFSPAGHQRPLDVQMREYDVMRKLNHRNIVPLLAIEDEQGTRKQVIVMQLTDHGSLFNMLEDPKNAYGLPEAEFLIVFEHISSGMKYIRDNGIVHRDIKPGNILRYKGEDGRSIYRLTDFGAAKEIENEEEQFMSLYGTEEYLHPDIYERAVLRNPQRRQFTSKVDLWSLGVTFFHVVTGQLPFKPYGGRKNRAKMFEITRHKDSGMIMGIQHIEGGPIDWSRELPHTCRISIGLKLLITPVLARLLESNPDRVWNFDAFFNEVDTIVKKKTISVFSPHMWSSLKIYINKDSNLSRLKELIAEQTDVQSGDQLLIYDGQPLEEHVQPMLPVSNYPEGIIERNPIICFSRNMEESIRFPIPVIKEFPKFTSSLTTEDYAISKLCSAISCYVLDEVKIYSCKQELVRRSVHLYIHVLYHECGHLVDYHLFLQKNCQSVINWKSNFLRTFGREINMIRLLIQQADSQLNYIILELEDFHGKCEREIEELAAQIEQLGVEVDIDLRTLKDNELQKKSLKKLWNDSLGCIQEDRCIAKVEGVVDLVLKIKAQFYEDRKRPTLNFNEEQIHKYEKNKLSEKCITLKSLFFDHCHNGARDQFNKFNLWYRSASTVRHTRMVIEGKLEQLADRLENFVTKLNSLCLNYHETMGCYIRKIDENLQTKQFISLRPEGMNYAHTTPVTTGQSSGLSSGSTGSKHQRHALIQAVLQGLLDNQNQVLEMRKELDTNYQIAQSFSHVLHIDESKSTQQKDF